VCVCVCLRACARAHAHVFVCVCVCTYVCVWADEFVSDSNIPKFLLRHSVLLVYVTTISRLPKIIGLFCRILPLL